MKTKISLFTLLLLGVAVLFGQQFVLASGPVSRPLGDSKVLAPVPFPGYPEGIAVHKGLVYVSGPAAFGVPGNFSPSKVFAFDIKTGALVRTITIQGQTSFFKAISCIAFGADDKLYVLDEGLGVLQIDLNSGQQIVYAAPFFPVYASAFNPPAPVLINDLAFDKQGYLYVTDSFQATIWRIAPGGGVPQVWFQDARLDGPFGPNGVRIDAKSNLLYLAQTFDGTGQGYIYTLPLVASPSASDLHLFHTYTPGADDGIAFGKSGNLYVALAGYSQISVLAPNGVETARYSGPAQNPGDPAHDPLPWTNPANIAFDKKSGTLLVTNHASLTNLPDPSYLFAVFDVYVNDKPQAL